MVNHAAGILFCRPIPDVTRRQHWCVRTFMFMSARQQFVSQVIHQSPVRRKPVSALRLHVCSHTHDQFVRVDEPFGATAAACMQKHSLLPDNGVCAIIARSSSSCVDGEGHPSVQTHWTESFYSSSRTVFCPFSLAHISRGQQWKLQLEGAAVSEQLLINTRNMRLISSRHCAEHYVSHCRGKIVLA